MWKQRIGDWAQRWAIGTKMAVFLAVAALVSGVATFVALTNANLQVTPRTVLYLLLVDLVLVLFLGALVALRLVRIWAARRSGMAGAKLHGRLVALFSLVAIAPTIIVAVFSALFLDLGLQTWFSDRFRNVLDSARSVAEIYTEEHRRVVQADLLAMANDLDRQANVLSQNHTLLEKVVSGQAALRNLFEAIVFDGSGRVLARANFGIGLGLDRLPISALEQADNGEVVILTSENDDRVRALVRLERFFDAYLYVSRYIDPRVLAQAEQAITEYERLEKERNQFHILFNAIFIVVAVLILLVAVWVGLWLATRLADPISRLVLATEKVREGDLTIRVAEGDTGDEIGTLNRAFNRMASQLQEQRLELMDANRQLDDRRRFTEAVLGGVTAGVLGLDQDGRINLPNRSALRMLDANAEDLIGQPLGDALPEFMPLFEAARSRQDRVAQGQVNLVRGTRARNLMVRVSAELSDDVLTGFVITFDDITQLVAAQRTAAWADVARRIAHEIKNPLTPIQLSAERLKRKYAHEVKEGRQTFDQCTDTIVRHVKDIRRMVDEFSAFARMPSPVFKAENLTELARQAVFLQEVAYPDIVYRFAKPKKTIWLTCDGRLVSQALTNVLKNASESIELKGEARGHATIKGEVTVTLSEDEDRTAITVADTGMGLPAELKARLTEPYVTTRAKGTGLGLAICKKVMEDHGGELVLDDRPEGGAVVELVFHHAALHEILERQRAEKEADGAPSTQTVATDE